MSEQPFDNSDILILSVDITGVRTSPWREPHREKFEVAVDTTNAREIELRAALEDLRAKALAALGL